MAKIKLVAIAKDEGAYLADWVFHHLYFGFDEIEVHINRSSDNTDEITKLIGSKYSKVRFINANWVDIAPDTVRRVMQYTIYSEAYWRAKYEEGFSHICFLDIDEFWTPKDFSSSIHHLIESLGTFSTLSFGWINVINESEFQSNPRLFYGYKDTAVKSIINLDSPITRMQLHLPEFDQNASNFCGSILADGNNIECPPKQPQHLTASLRDKDYPAYIHHRMFRSQLEYTALLLRGNPRGNTPFKMNRPGYVKNHAKLIQIEHDENAYNKYEQTRTEFIKNLQINDALNNAQEFIRTKAEDSINALEYGINNANPEFYEGLVRIFNNLDSERVEIARQEILSKTKTVKHVSSKVNKITLKSVLKKLMR